MLFKSANLLLGIALFFTHFSLPSQLRYAPILHGSHPEYQLPSADPPNGVSPDIPIAKESIVVGEDIDMM